MRRSPLVSKKRWQEFFRAIGAVEMTPAIAWGILREVPGIRFSNKETVRRRWVRCNHCILYDHIGKVCRGCHCYMGFKALSAFAKCWLNEHHPDAEYGWRDS